MTNAQFDLVTNMQYAYKAMRHRVKAFESGEKYVSMKNEHTKQLRAKDVEIKKLKLELAKANSTIVTVRNNYFQVVDEIEEKHRQELKAKDERINTLFERSLRAERRADRHQDDLINWKKRYYEVGAQLVEQEEINRKLVVQLKRNHENSSLPSSAKHSRAKIHNSREKTGKLPGGQPGHKGHVRKTYHPTSTIMINPPEEYLDTSRYEPTGRIIRKQVVGLRVLLNVNELTTPEYRALDSGKIVHAPFPEGVVNEVSYDSSIKAFAFMLNNYCNVSIEKVREFLTEITDGQLEISHGMISGLSKEFSKKTEKERGKIFEELLNAPTLCADFTTARNSGKQVNVLVCGAPSHVMYFARERKGFDGISGTPLVDYVGTVVHDHDVTFYRYGTNHQECISHPLRYLKGSIENEKSRTWNIQMREILQEMIHYRNSQDDEAMPNQEKVSEFKDRWRQILKVAEVEYDEEPPNKYYKEGYNLFKRFDKYMDYHFTFLEDFNVPATNNFAERALRLVKRKQHAAVTFRSFEGLEYYCDALTMIGTLRLQGRKLYKAIADYFE